MKRPITAEDLYRLTWVGDAAMSLDATSIAYVSQTVNEERNGYCSSIHVVKADGTADQVFTEGEQDSAPSWSSDGSTLAFIRKRGDRQQVWGVPTDGGVATALTPDDIVVSSFAWSPDSSRLLLHGKKVKPADQPKGVASPTVQVVERLKWRSDGEGSWNGIVTQLFVIGVDDLKTVRTVTEIGFDVLASAWSPSGERIAFSARKLDGDTDPDRTLTQDLFVVDPDGGEPCKLTESRYVIHRLAFAPCGTRLVFIGHDRQFGGATHNDLYAIPLDGGEASRLSEGLDVHVGNAVVNDMRSALPSPLIVSQDGKSYYALASVQGNVQVCRFADGGEYEQITQGDREVYHFVGQPDDGTLIIASADALSPGDLYRLDMTTRSQTRLTRSNDDLLNEIWLSAPEPFWTTAPDGGSLHGWYMKPVGAVDDGKKYPVILEIHGGPHAMYGNTFVHEFQLLAAQGYGVIFANPRGSHGYGQHFADACRRNYGGGDYLDVLAAVDYAVKHDPNVDEARLGVTGGSYGGFLTNWIVGHTNRFRAAVTQRSISNWLSFYGTSDIGYYFAEEEIGGSPWCDTEAFWKQSPIAYADAVETPLLILHGENDLRCPIEQAEQWYVALKKLGKKTQFVRFPESSHELSRKGHPQLRIERLNRITGWFKHYL
ncbi:Prolyl tripeptidyl peptidase precursor [compost metagenome]